MNFLENNYDSEKLSLDINKLNKYKNAEISTIGNSVLNKPIYSVKIGHGKINVCYIGAHHALEWITSSLLMAFSYNILNKASLNERYCSYNIDELFNKITFHIIPMLNPDGVDIVNNNPKSCKNYESLLQWNKGDNFKTKWQSNANGVDLNHNYDAGFELAKKAEKEYGITGPTYTRYSGPYPESEPETKALCNYIRENDFSMLIAYHSQGEVIYYDYNNMVPPKGKEIGKILSKKTGYALDNTSGISSYSGCKDWFIEKFNKPAFTIEVGKGKNPLSFSQFDKIYNDNIEAMIIAPLLC